MKKMRWLAAVLGLAVAALVGGCGQLEDLEPTPVKVTLNGYGIDRATGTVSFNLSAFDRNNDLIESGTVENPSVKNLVAEDSFGNPLNGISGTATICGEITVQDNVTCAIVLDATGSMANNDPYEKRNEAAKAFVDRMTTGDLAGVASFDTSTSPTGSYLAIHVWQDFTSDKQSLRGAIDDATFANGGTPLWDAVYDSVDWLDTQTGDNPIALVLTDGGDTGSSKSSTDAANYADSKDIKVYMVGLGDNLNFQEMQDVASQTGGLFAVASDPDGLTALFDGIFNASKASFCIEVTFTINGNPPPSGTRITGTLEFTLNGKVVEADFEVEF